MNVGGSPAVARYRLRLALREAREAKGLTQRQVARQLDWSLSKVNRIEAGEVTVSGTDVQAMLRIFDVTDLRQVTELTEDARAARKHGWWDQHEFREHLTPAMVESLQFETDATAIRSFQPTFIPGPLQTRAYAVSIFDLWGEVPDEVRAARVDARMRRREQLRQRPDRPSYILVLDESVLLREVGGKQVMSEQLYQLLNVAQDGGITVRVVPLAQATVYAAFGSFTLYAIGDEDVALYRESQQEDEIVHAAERIQSHRQRFEEVVEQSLSPEASIRLIEARAATMRSGLDR